MNRGKPRMPDFLIADRGHDGARFREVPEGRKITPHPRAGKLQEAGGARSTAAWITAAGGR